MMFTDINRGERIDQDIKINKEQVINELVSPREDLAYGEAVTKWHYNEIV